MKRIALWLLVAVVAWIPGGAHPVWGEEPSAVLRLELTLSRRPAAVQPVPDPKIAEQDTEEAITEIKGRQRSEELLRETLSRPSRRPHLHYDVWSGIQSRNVTEALRKR